jgi:hypothetical protein
VTIDANRRHIERVTAHASGRGVVSVEATLLAPDGQPIGPSSVFTLRATTYGWWGWGILGAGLALFVAALLFRRHRLQRRGVSELRPTRDRSNRSDGDPPEGRASGRGDLRVHDGGASR